MALLPEHATCTSGLRRPTTRGRRLGLGARRREWKRPTRSQPGAAGPCPSGTSSRPQGMLKGTGGVTELFFERAQKRKPCDARNALFHKLTSPQSRPCDACAQWLLDQRYGHLHRPLHNLSRPTQLDRQTSCDVRVTISFKSRGALSFAHPTMAHTLARASLIVSRGSSSRWM